MKRKVYILLTDTGTIFTRMIKLYTKKPLNHASIAFDEQLQEVYSFGRKKQRNPFIGGFVRENTRKGLFEKAKCAIYCCSLTDQQFQEINRIIDEMDKHKHHYRYNLIGLVAVMLNMEFERKNAYFCSQFVASVLEESGIRLVKNKPLSLVTPNDIKESPQLELVYEGSLSSYLGKEQPSYRNHLRVKAV
ncbi:hypothetical protein [Bacillus massilinigeriensis]|uniref:hypothetical protein n=1 Tax=Bacillus massilionigeriensis TaxID=1805475 RepID=UPI00096B25FE|nr:hypothetical protein [Bacillus massilionigeriensis]